MGMIDKKHNRNFYIVIAFLAPVLLTAASFAAIGAVPFGDNSIAISDANGYYLPYLSYCRSVFRGEHSLLYSFSQNIGGGIIATIWPYLFNPFAWIVALFDYEQYPLAYSLGVMLMDGLYGMTMYLYLSDQYGQKISGLLISTAYALCGFNVAFVFYTAFFCGGPLFLPLMALGQRKLLRGESPILYAISIAWPLILQIQMGFAICMASALFFLAECWMDKSVFRRCWLRYVLASLFGGLMGAFVWLPELMVLKQGRGSLSIADFTFTANAPFLEMAARFFTGAGSIAQIVDGFPAVFCGILPVALTVLFFLDEKTKRRKKIAFAALLAVYTIGFYIRVFTSVFQGFTHANWFNYRFSFVFTFLVLHLSMEELQRLEYIPLRRAVFVGVGILMVSLLVFFKSYEFVDGAMLILDMALLAVMGGGFWFYKTKPEKAPEKTLILLFCLCTFLQLYLNVYFCTRRVFDAWEKEGNAYAESIMKKEPLISAIQAADPSFYRIESELELQGSVGNDSLFLGYNGVGFAGHTERSFVSSSLGRLGLDFFSYNWTLYDPGVPAALDTVLGIKYVVSERNLAEEKGYNKIIELFGESLYENPLALPVAFVSGEKITEVSIEDEIDAFSNLNAIWRAVAGDISDVFTEETEIAFSNHNPNDTVIMTYSDVERASGSDVEIGSPSKADEEHRFSPYIEYDFIAKRTGPVYLYDTAPIIKAYGTAEDVLQYVGCYRAGERVIGRMYLDYAITEKVMTDTLRGLHICYANMDLLKEYSDLIRSRSTTIVKESDSRLSGEATLEKGQRLLFTIPYDEGWTLIVDGAEVPLDKTADLFMSASLGAGTHYYELVFWPVGLTTGISVSILALLGLIALSIIFKNHRRNHCIAETNDGEPADGIVPELDQELPKRDTTETTELDGSSTENA